MLTETKPTLPPAPNPIVAPYPTPPLFKKWHALVADMRASGYRYTFGNQLDRDAARDTICPECGVRQGFEAFSKTVSYRAFTLCPECGRHEEF